MKIRNVISVVAMLSLFLFSAGTASAIYGVNDAVPGQDVVIPIICEGYPNPPSGQPTLGGLDTIFAIAEKGGGTPAFPNEYVVCAKVFVKDKRSVERYDTEYCWTKYDVVGDSCSNLIKEMGVANQVEMNITTSDGRRYFAGYVEISQTWVPPAGLDPENNVISNRFIPWVYLTDLNKGFASGMNGITAEDGIGPRIGEDAGNVAVAAGQIFPRIFIMNNKADTWNWWMLLLGRNAYTQLTLPSFQRDLTCFLCDEEEDCKSKDIPIPNELNLINVLDVINQSLIPACWFAGEPACPIAGFGRCGIREVGEVLVPPALISISGTANAPTIDPLYGQNPWYSLYGWSYQRAQMSTTTLSWDVIHEMHRLYCSGAIPGAGPSDNAIECSFAGF